MWRWKITTRTEAHDSIATKNQNQEYSFQKANQYKGSNKKSSLPILCLFDYLTLSTKTLIVASKSILAKCLSNAGGGHRMQNCNKWLIFFSSYIAPLIVRTCMRSVRPHTLTCRWNHNCLFHMLLQVGRRTKSPQAQSITCKEPWGRRPSWDRFIHGRTADEVVCRLSWY